MPGVEIRVCGARMSEIGCSVCMGSTNLNLKNTVFNGDSEKGAKATGEEKAVVRGSGIVEGEIGLAKATERNEGSWGVLYKVGVMKFHSFNRLTYDILEPDLADTSSLGSGTTDSRDVDGRDGVEVHKQVATAGDM